MFFCKMNSIFINDDARHQVVLSPLAQLNLHMKLSYGVGNRVIKSDQRNLHFIATIHISDQTDH